MLSVCLGRPGRSTGSCQRSEFDRCAVDRPVDRQGISGKSSVNGYFLKLPINTPFERVFLQDFLVRIFPDSLVFSKQSKEIFVLDLNNLFWCLIRVWKYQRKGVWEKLVIELLYIVFLIFPKDFLCDF